MRKFLTIVGYHADAVQNFFGAGSRYKIAIQYATQVVQDGTGRVVDIARNFAGNSAFVLSYGDILVDPQNYKSIVDLPDDIEAIITVTRGEDVSKGGAAFLNERMELIDLREKSHLVVWAIIAGMLWAVANTLTVFAIRNVGLSIAFPLWNTNSLVGLFWGWLLFNELRGAGTREWVKVLGVATAIVIGACLLAYATSQHTGGPPRAATLGILSALGAGLMWGTMYIPYRKAYISGMNPLSFVTVLFG